MSHPAQFPIHGVPSAAEKPNIFTAAQNIDALSSQECLDMARLANCAIGDALLNLDLENGDIQLLIDCSSVLMHAAAQKRRTLRAVE